MPKILHVNEGAVQILHPLSMGIKFPTPWNTLIIKFPPPRDGKGVKCPGYARGGEGHVEASIWPIHYHEIKTNGMTSSALMCSYPLSGDSCLEKVNFISTILPTLSYWCLIVNGHSMHDQNSSSSVEEKRRRLCRNHPSPKFWRSQSCSLSLAKMVFFSASIRLLLNRRS